MSLNLIDIELFGFNNSSILAAPILIYTDMNSTSNTTVVLQNANFHDNTAEALFQIFYDEGPALNQTIDISGCQFNNNQAKLMLIFCDHTIDGSQYLHIHNSTFVSNNQDFLFLINHVVIANSTFDVLIDSSHFYDSYAVLALSTRDNATQNVVVINSTFVNGTSNDTGGCISLWCELACNQSVTLTNNTFLNNSHTMTGGVLAMAGQSGPVNQSLTLSNNIWNGNQANDGGCIYLNGPAGGSQVIYVNGDNVFDNAQNNGGFLYLNGTSPVLELYHSNFTNNTAAEKGGIFYITNNGSAQINTTLTNTSFATNKATEGAVIYSEGPLLSLNLTGNQFSQHNIPSLFYLNATRCLVNSTANEYTNNIHSDSQFAILITQPGQFVSDSDQITQNIGRWLDVQMNANGSQTNVTISHLIASNPQSWQLLNMATIDNTSTPYSNGQNLTLLNVSITGEGSQTPYNSSLITLQGSVFQLLNVTHSVISQVGGTTFNLTATANTDMFPRKGFQQVYFQNTTLNQLITSDLGALYLNGSYSEQMVEWGDTRWEACQGTLLWWNNTFSHQRLNITNCQFEQNTALNGPLLVVASNVGLAGVASFTSFTSNRFINNQAKDAIINLTGPTDALFVNHTVVNDSPLHLWVTNDTSYVNLTSVRATYMSSTPLLAKWEVSEVSSISLGQLELTLLNGTSNVTLLNYPTQPQAWSSAVVNYANTTRGCFNDAQLLYNATNAFVVLSPVECPALLIPSDSTGNITLTGIMVLYPNQTLNVSTSVHIQVEQEGCLLLEGDLHLRLDASALPNSNQTLIEGCFEGVFGNVTFDNASNPQICQVSPLYASSQVLLHLQACDSDEPAVVGLSGPIIGAIVGGVVGGVVLLVIVTLLLIFLVKPIHERIFPHHNRVVDM